MIPLDVDALLAKTYGKSSFAGVTRVTEVTQAPNPSNHAGQELLTAVTHADPLQGNTGNMPEAGAPDSEAVTPVTQQPPALGNRGMGLQGIDMARVSEAVTSVTRVTQQKEYAAHARETPAVSWRCWVCHGTRRWRSIYGAVVCARCHPPADVALVTAWEGGE
jgi:hypothetical protein